MTLLEIGDDLTALMDLLEESGGEVTEETEAAINAWFAEVGQAQEQKLDGYAALIRDFTLKASARKEEQERLAMRVRADEATAKRLKDRLKLYMELTGQKKVETRRYKIAICNNGGKLPVEVSCHPTELPPAYQRVTVAADVDAIRADLEGGKEIAGAALLPRATHVRIS